MKEIKAYIRGDKAEEVMAALDEAGAGGFTVVEVNRPGREVAGERASYSLEYGERLCPAVKLELVCREEDVVRLVDVISENARTDHRGDGVIFVSDIVHAIKIRTGEWGDSALLPSS